MAKEPLLLGYWFSPYSRRVELALRIKGVEFDYREEDLSNKSPLLLESNPVYGKIPVLFHKGEPIAESLIILEYIDEAWPGGRPLLPQDPYRRATARFWAAFVDEKIFKTGFKYLMASGTEHEEALEEFHQQLEFFQHELRSAFFGGEAIGFVDAMAFFVIQFLQAGQEVTGRLLFDEQKFPRILNWAAKLHEMDEVKQTLPPRDQQLDHFRVRIEELRSATL